MYSRLRLLIFWIMVATVTLGSISNHALAQSLVSPVPVAIPTSDPFALGKTLAKPNTLEFQNLDALIAKVAGKPSMDAFEKYEGGFNRYWEVSRSGRAGKVFEAVTAFTENRRLARAGNPNRIVLTAAEGNPGDAADAVLIGPDGTILKRYQLKLSWKIAKDALFEPKYSGMTIVLPSDQMEILTHELAKAEYKALRRGLPLETRWQDTKNAIHNGRITATMVSGKITSSKDIFITTERQLLAAWTRLGSEANTPNVATTPKASGVKKVLGKTLARRLIVIGIAAEGYQLYTDLARYRSGEIGGGHLATKVAMQSAQFGLSTALLVAPEPFVTKIAGLVVIVVVFTGADQIIESAYEKRQDHARRLLETIDREERFLYAREQLLK